MTDNALSQARNLPVIVKIIKIMSLGLALIGLCLFLDLGDLASIMNLKKDEMHKTLGLMVIAMGAIDYYLIPKILIKRLQKE